MVSLNLDFYRLIDSIHREAVRRLEAIDAGIQPVDSGWLLFGLSTIGSSGETLFQAVTRNLEAWVMNSAGGKDRDLGPICICITVSKDAEVKKTGINKAKQILDRSTNTRGKKFHVLNDPEQVFCASLVSDELESNHKQILKEISRDNATGKLSRKVFYLAATANLGESISHVPALENGDDVEDIVSLLWFGKNYTEGEAFELWAKLEKLLPLLMIGSGPDECRISSRTLALLADAVSTEVRDPNHNMMFDLMPLAPDIKKIVKDQFKQKKYASAVFEATKKLNEMIQGVTSINKGESQLVQATMRPEKTRLPIIQFNDHLDEESGMNEQDGLYSIAKGIFSGFRNPKGHKPEDHDLVKMSPYECISQLVTIDYIWQRVQSAKIVKPK